MASNLADLVASLTAETSQWHSNLDAALKKFQDFHSSVASTVLQIGEVLGVGLSVDKVVEFSDEILNSAASLERLSQETGAAVEELSALQGAAKITGIDDLGNSLIRLTRAQGQVESGNKQVIGAFAAIGISAKEVASLNPDQLLLRIADAYTKYSDGAGKAAVTQDIFGRGSANMVPLLDQGSEGIKGLTDNVKELGGVTSADFAAAAAAFEGDLQRMKLAIEGTAEGILAKLLPAIDSGIIGITTFVSETKDVGSGFEAIGTGIKLIADALITSDALIGQLKDDIANLYEGSLDELEVYYLGVKNILTGGRADVSQQLTDAQDALAKLDEKYHQDEQTRQKAANDALQALWSDRAQQEITAQKNLQEQLAEFLTFNPEKPQVQVPDTKATESAIKQLQDALDSLRQKAQALNLSDGLKPSELEAAQASLAFGKLHDDVAKAAAEGPILAQQYLVAAAALDKLEAAADVKKLTDQLQQQVATFGLGSIAVARYADSHGELAKLMGLTTDKGEAERAEYERLTATLAKQQDAVALVQLNAQLDALKGNTAAAAGQLFDLQHQALTSNLTSEGDAAGLQKIKDARDATVAQAQFNDELQKEQVINDALSAQISATEALKAQGYLTDNQAAAIEDDQRKAALDQLTQMNAVLGSIADASQLPKLQQQYQAASTSANNLAAQTDQVAKSLKNDVINSATDDLTAFADGSKSAGQAFGDFVTSVADDLLKLSIKDELESFFSPAGSSTGGGAGGLFTSIAALFTPKAAGGPVSSGKPYWVGEEGPEAFVPATNGVIIPTGASMGGHTVINNFNIQAPAGTVSRGTQQQLAAAAARGIAAANARNN